MGRKNSTRYRYVEMHVLDPNGPKFRMAGNEKFAK